MNYGYARCSTSDQQQDINRQIRELKAAGAEEVLFEYEHGDAAVKEQLSLLLERMVDGDTIMVLEVSRLSRSVQQLCEIIDRVEKKHLRLMIMGSITIDCRGGDMDPMTRAFIQMAAVFAELELNMIRARVRSGIENARAKGVVLGRPRKCVDDIPAQFMKYYARYTKGDISKTELSRLTGYCRSSVYKYIEMLESDSDE